jgi:hypothetical protein
MVAAAAIIMTVRLTPGRRVACLALAAVFVELGTQWPYVTDWLRDVRIYLTYGQTKFHVFSVLPEVAVWIGAPLAAAVVSGIIMNWLWTPRSGVRGGPTRS